MTTTPLMDRILAAEQRSQLRYLRPAEPTPIRKARWVQWTQENENRGKVLYNGAFVPGGDRGAA
jgi:hypothetical protein